ncbi:MAG: LysM peptidoglycan-binding domain-containing protein [Pseudobdellovibrionaceae bacterium]
MMNKFFLFLACLGLALQLSSCTSKESQADSAVAADADSADLEKLEGGESLQAAGDSLPSDQLPEDALGETPAPAPSSTPAPAPAPSPAPADTGIANQSPPAPAPAEKPAMDNNPATPQMDVASTPEPLPADPLAQAADIPALPPTSPTDITKEPSTVTDGAIGSEEKKSASSTTVVDNTESSKKTGSSLQKVATAPWKVGKKWVNTVYFARPGDTLAGISQMIYGTNKVSELKKENPSLKARSVKPGDKIYYNSPNRPEDSVKMISYYEDNGMAPEVYVAKSGDNIKKVSKKLLGYSNAWKEVWSLNTVDSKGAISEGTELHYWKGGNIAAAPIDQMPKHEEIAGLKLPSTKEPQLPPPPPVEPAKPEIPPPQQQAQAEIPPPPPMPEQKSPDTAQPPPLPPDVASDQNQQMAPPPPPPPPPPPVEAVNPPAPPAPPKKHKVAEEAPPSGMDNDTTLALGVVGIAAAGLAGLIVVRKKRKQKELEQQGMDTTHVG